jgi:hypothetical protein
MKAVVTAALAAIVLTLSMSAWADSPPKPVAGAKPSSFAPHHTGRRVYGAPIQPPIFGPQKRAHHKATKATPTKSTAAKKKAKKPASKAVKPAETIKEAAKG